MTIYIGNINYNATDNELQELFAQYGEVQSCEIKKNKHTRESKGFAFVEMDEEAGVACCELLNGFIFMNRPLKVNKAKEKNY